MTAEASEGGPWYRHSWPWFIVILLGTTVVAGISTVFIAVRGADPLVADNYYRDGKAINRTLAADREATLREVVARVQPAGPVALELEILGEAPASLRLELSHVTRAELDRSLRLNRTADGSYAGSESLPEGVFYLTLMPDDAGASWRLRRRIALPTDAVLVLEPDA